MAALDLVRPEEIVAAVVSVRADAGLVASEPLQEVLVERGELELAFAPV